MSLTMEESNNTSPRRSSRLELKQTSPRSSSSDAASIKENTILRLELSPDSVTSTRDTTTRESFETPPTHPQCALTSRKNILHSGLDSEGESPRTPTSTPTKNNLRKCPTYSPKYSPSSSPRWHHRFRKALAEVSLEESNRTLFETGSFYGRKVEKKSAFELKLSASQLGLPARSPSLPSVNQSVAKIALPKKHMPATSRAAVKHRSTGSSKKMKVSSAKKSSSTKKPLPSSKKETVKSANQESTNATSGSTSTTPSPPRMKRKFFSRSATQLSPSKRPRSSFKMGNHNVSVLASKYSPKRKCLSTSSSSSGSPQKIRTSPRRQKVSPRSSSLPSSPLSDSRIAPQNLDFTNDFETSFSTTNGSEMQGTGLFEEPPHDTEMEVDGDPKLGNTSDKKERAAKTSSQNSLSTNPKGKNLFPIFFRRRSISSNTSSPKTPATTPRKSKLVTSRRSRLRSTKKDNLEQLVIDVGQKEVAAFQCDTCGMYYTPCDEEDNITHTRYHNILQTNLKFSGWKKEKVVAEFHDGRIIHINPDDPSYAQRKMKEVRDVVDEELGFAESDAHKGKKYHAFLFIADKKVVGCVLAETISAAFRIIDDTSNSSLCCSETGEKALCGISRIWTLKTHRKNKIASRLMETLRSHFLFGYVMSKDDIAFSMPTQDGQKFAASYTGRSTFLVYK